MRSSHGGEKHDLQRLAQEFPWIQDAFRVECRFDSKVGFVGGVWHGLTPPALFGDADSVLAGDGSIPGDDLAEKLIESDFGALADELRQQG